MVVPSYHYLIGPLVALAAVGVLALVLRWIYSGDRPTPPRRRPSGPADYGLLVSVTAVPDAAEAQRLRALFHGHGIRTTLAPGPDGGAQVLVFRSDEGRARALLTSSG